MWPYVTVDLLYKFNHGFKPGMPKLQISHKKMVNFISKLIFMEPLKVKRISNFIGLR